MGKTTWKKGEGAKKNAQYEHFAGNSPPAEDHPTQLQTNPLEVTMNWLKPTSSSATPTVQESDDEEGDDEEDEASPTEDQSTQLQTNPLKVVMNWLKSASSSAVQEGLAMARSGGSRSSSGSSKKKGNQVRYYFLTPDGGSIDSDWFTKGSPPPTVTQLTSIALRDQRRARDKGANGYWLGKRVRGIICIEWKSLPKGAPIPLNAYKGGRGAYIAKRGGEKAWQKEYKRIRSYFIGKSDTYYDKGPSYSIAFHETNAIGSQVFDESSNTQLRKALDDAANLNNQTASTSIINSNVNLMPELDDKGNSIGILTDKRGNYTGYQSIPKCYPVVLQNRIIGYSSIADDTNYNDPTTKLLSKDACKDYKTINGTGVFLVDTPTGVSYNNGETSYNAFNGTNSMPQQETDLQENVQYVTKLIENAIKYYIYLLSYPFLYIQNTILKFSNMVTKSFSSVGFYKTVSPSEVDKLCVYVTFQNVIWYFICIWVFFNWFYLICYRENDKPVKTYDISWIWIRNTNILLSLLFKYVVCQVSFFNAILMFFQRYANFFLGNIWGPKFNAILLFIIILALILYADIGAKLINLLFQSLTASISNNLVAILMVMALIFAFYTFLIEDKIILFLKFGSIIAGIFTIILFILRILWSFLIIWVASLLIAVYFLVYSLFAILIYSRASAWETVQQIFEYITMGFNDPSPFKYSACRPRTWTEWFIELIKFAIKIFIQYIFEIIFIFMLLYNIYVYVTLMGDNANLQNAMVVLTTFIILGVLGHILRRLYPASSMATVEKTKEVQKALGVFNPSDYGRDDKNTLFPGLPNLASKFTNMFLPTVEGEAARKAAAANQPPSKPGAAAAGPKGGKPPGAPAPRPMQGPRPGAMQGPRPGAMQGPRPGAMQGPMQGQGQGQGQGPMQVNTGAMPVVSGNNCGDRG